jgi:glutamyl-tRNA synthetase
MSVRVRFAPSPTGYLHIGGLRTALFNFLFARKEGGTFVLRIEDTDRSRFVEDAESDILESLAWAGISHDEGPDVGGGFGPYRQSERLDDYTGVARALVEAGRAYYAFDTPEELERMRRGESGDSGVSYDAQTRLDMRNSLVLSESEVSRLIGEGASFVVRLKVEPGREIEFDDVVRGLVTFSSSGIDDQVLLKSDGYPTYHLANVVDDHRMGITHVIRGEEWLPSTPKHILLYESLGWEPPRTAHLPLILSPNGGKLSKRSADRLGIPVTVRQYREAGYEPEGLVNFLAMLGWNPGDEQEVFDLTGLVESFDLERVGSSGVQFDLDKLRWFNQQHLRLLDESELVERLKPWVEAAGRSVDPSRLAQVARLMVDRSDTLADLPSQATYFFEDPVQYDEKTVKRRWKPGSSDLLTAFAARLERIEIFDEGSIEESLRDLAEVQEVSAGALIHPARLAVSGVGGGPGLFELMAVLGREACVRRLRKASSRLG